LPSPIANGVEDSFWKCPDF